MRKRTSATEVSASDEGCMIAPPQYAWDSATTTTLTPCPHSMEQEVLHELMSEPNLRFASLVIRRIDDGVCLQGVIEDVEDAPDICSIARRVKGVNQVINHVVCTKRAG